MSEVKRLWVVWDLNISAEEFFNDPAIKDEAQQVEQFIGEHTMSNILWQVQAMGAQKFEKGHVKFYDDEASAKKDAVSRLAKLKKRLRMTASNHSSVSMRVAARFAAAGRRITELQWIKRIDAVGKALVNLQHDLSPWPGIETFANPTPEQLKQDQKLTKEVESLLLKAEQYVNEASVLVEKSQ
jgi:hypothetical protein